MIFLSRFSLLEVTLQIGVFENCFAILNKKLVIVQNRRTQRHEEIGDNFMEEQISPC